MLTATQHDQLPGTAHASIDLAAITHHAVTPLDSAKRAELCEFIKDRFLPTTAAHETWGEPLRSDGMARA